MLLWCVHLVNACSLTAELLVPHTVAKRVQRVFCGELNHKQTLIRLQLPLYFRATFPLRRTALVWLNSPSLVCRVLVACTATMASGLSFCPSLPNALPQFSSHPSAISVLTSSTCSLIRGDVPSAPRFTVLISNDHLLLTMISDSSACTGGRS